MSIFACRRSDPPVLGGESSRRSLAESRLVTETHPAMSRHPLTDTTDAGRLVRDRHFVASRERNQPRIKTVREFGVCRRLGST